jgi:serine/threonine protein kinase
MGKRFHDYYLTEQLTSKPLRSVYLAHHVSDDSQKVVVKIFDSRCLNIEQEDESLLQKAKWVKQFMHAHIVPVLDIGIEQGQPYIVSKYESSGSLRQFLNRLSPQHLNLEDALSIIFQVGRALRYAHEHNVLHGNIKPENIFFDEQGKALLADFCIADFIDVTKLDHKSDPHTRCYMAPEQSSGIINEKSDQYGLACLAYELITGHTPSSVQGFSPMLTKQHTERAICLSDLVSDLPEQVEEVVLKAMAKDPHERYANISIFIRALEALSLSSMGAPSSSPIAALHHSTPVKSTSEPLEALATIGPAMRVSEAPLTTGLRERSEHLNNEHSANQTLDTSPNKTSRKSTTKTFHKSPTKIFHRSTSQTLDSPSSKTLSSSSSKTLDSPSSKTLSSSSSKTLDSPSSKTLSSSSSKTLDSPSSKTLPSSSSKTLDLSSSKTLPSSSSKTLDSSSSKTLSSSSSKILARLVEDAHVESLSTGGPSQSRKQLSPTFWVAFALSGIVLLWGIVIPYAFVPPHSSGSEKSSRATHATPTAQPQRDEASSSSTQPEIQANLIWSYAKPTRNVYNLTNEGTLDWIHWGLNSPQDVNHKLDVQQQISSFTLIGNGTVQRDNSYAKAYTWSDGTPVMIAPPQQRSGVYVRGIGNGFTFTVVASTTPRTLRVYVGAAHAEGNFSATINGYSFTDTSLDTRNAPYVENNRIYTLTFSSNVPDQVLTVKYTVQASDASNGYVMLEAATLQD